MATRESGFSAAYVALLAAVGALAAALGLALTDERGAGLPAPVEETLLVGGALLLAAAGMLSGRSPGPARLLGLTGLTVVAVVLLLTLREGGSSAAILETLCVVLGVLFLGLVHNEGRIRAATRSGPHGPGGDDPA